MAQDSDLARALWAVLPPEVRCGRPEVVACGVTADAAGRLAQLEVLYTYLLTHLYECSKGHPYVVGECGKAEQYGTCVDCGETTAQQLRGQRTLARLRAYIRSLAGN